MNSESLLFDGYQGIKLFLDVDIYSLKDNIEVQKKEAPKVPDSFFIETPTIVTQRPTAKLMVLVENAEKTNKSAKETEFITKLVNAVGIHMKDVLVRSVEDSEKVESKKAIVFYSPIEKVKLLPIFESYNQELNKYSPLTVYNQQIVWADNLDLVIESVELKKSLWASLKAMFGLV